MTATLAAPPTRTAGRRAGRRGRPEVLYWIADARAGHRAGDHVRRAAWSSSLLTSLMTDKQALTGELLAAQLALGQLRRGVRARRRCCCTCVNTVHLRGGWRPSFMLLSSRPGGVRAGQAALARAQTGCSSLIICMMMLPPQVTTVPLYLMWAQLRTSPARCGR